MAPHFVQVYNTTDAGHVRIKLLAAGAEYAERAKKRETGFVTGAGSDASR